MVATSLASSASLEVVTGLTCGFGAWACQFTTLSPNLPIALLFYLLIYYYYFYIYMLTFILL